MGMRLGDWERGVDDFRIGVSLLLVCFLFCGVSGHAAKTLGRTLLSMRVWTVRAEIQASGKQLFLYHLLLTRSL